MYVGRNKRGRGGKKKIIMIKERSDGKSRDGREKEK